MSINEDAALEPLVETLNKMEGSDKTEALIKMQRYVNEIMEREEDLAKLSDEELEEVAQEWVGEDELKKAAMLSVLGRFARMKGNAALRGAKEGAASLGSTIQRKAIRGYASARGSAKRGLRAAGEGINNAIPSDVKAAWRGARGGGPGDAFERAGREIGRSRAAAAGISPNRYVGGGKYQEMAEGYADRGRKIGRYAKPGLAIAGAGAAYGAGHATSSALGRRDNRKSHDIEDLQKGALVRGARALEGIASRGANVARETAAVVGHNARSAYNKPGKYARVAGRNIANTAADVSDTIAAAATRAKGGAIHAARVGEVNAKRNASLAYRGMRDFVAGAPGRVARAYGAMEDSVAEFGGKVGAHAGGMLSGAHPNRYISGDAHLKARNSGRMMGEAAGRYGLRYGAPAAAGAAAIAGGAALTQKQIEQRRAAGKASAAKRRGGG